MSNEKPSEALIHRFIRSLVKESDRGCALVGAAHLDRDLEKLLRTTLRRASKASEKDLNYLLDSPLAPLRPFALRIRMAHALGLIPLAVRTTLNAIREIRNDFAHQEDASDFPPKLIAKAIEYPMKGWVNAEGTVTNERDKAEDEYAAFAADAARWRPKPSEMRVKFVFAVVWLRSYFTVRNPDAYPDYYKKED